VILAFRQEQGSWVRAIAQVVLEYLQAHPQAADTAEGVSAWWLGTSRRDRRVPSVVEALDALVARGTVRCEATPAGETVYRLRRPVG
jgi:predicted SnoaL-like aldol condensation-catalyzing enzyme